jgi:hypothetical protein
MHFGRERNSATNWGIAMMAPFFEGGEAQGKQQCKSIHCTDRSISQNLRLRSLVAQLQQHRLASRTARGDQRGASVKTFCASIGKHMISEFCFPLNPRLVPAHSVSDFADNAYLPQSKYKQLPTRCNRTTVVAYSPNVLLRNVRRSAPDLHRVPGRCQAQGPRPRPEAG